MSKDYFDPANMGRIEPDSDEPTLFGYPIEITLTLGRLGTVDLTHALRWDKDTNTIVLDRQACMETITAGQRFRFERRPR